MSKYKENRIIECKLSDVLAKIKHKCVCGHVVLIPERNKFVYCNHCNRKVFKNDLCKFEYELLRHMGKVNNEQVQS